MTEEYKKWVAWEKQNTPGEPLTRTQYEFAEYVLQSEELTKMLMHPGDLLSIMQRIQRYIKHQ